MKIVGCILLVLGFFITLGGVLIEKEVSFSDVMATNRRITFIGWGTVIALLGITILFMTTLEFD